MNDDVRYLSIGTLRLLIIDDIKKKQKYLSSFTTTLYIIDVGRCYTYVSVIIKIAETQYVSKQAMILQ